MQRIEAAAELRQLARGVQTNAAQRAEAVGQARAGASGWNPLVRAKHLRAGEQLEVVAAHEQEPRTRLAADEAVGLVALGPKSLKQLEAQIRKDHGIS
jgi:hypothetical protein